MNIDKNTPKNNPRQHHPYADLFPMMDAEPFRQLTASIREEGLQNPIISYQGKVLDGRNRLLACSNAQVEPRFEEYKGDDPLGFVFRANLIRRHLSISQRAMVAEKFANLDNGERASQKCEAVTRRQAADILNVSPRTLDNAKVVRSSGDDELIKAVEQGDISVSAAAKKTKGLDGQTEYNRQKRQWESKAHHLSLDGCVTSLCGIEKTYKGHRGGKLIDPLTLPSLVSGLPEELPGVRYHKGVCADCWRKLMVITTPAADKAARDALKAYRMTVLTDEVANPLALDMTGTRA